MHTFFWKDNNNILVYIPDIIESLITENKTAWPNIDQLHSLIKIIHFE